MKSIIEYHDYIDLLKDLIACQPNSGRGVQTDLAEKLGCQQAYLSKVLAKKADLNTDQANGICQYFALSDSDTDYFINLVLLNRAGTARAKAYWQSKLQNIVRVKQELKKRLGDNTELKVEDKAIYYSDWSYAAIHVLTSIEAFQTPQAIAARLQLDLQKVRARLAFLEKINLVTKKNDHYKITQASIHIGSDNAFVVNHHRNWRLRTLEKLGNSQDDLHYSSVVTCSKADRIKIKEALINAIEQVRKIARTSKDESIYSYGIDFLEL
jgi:uncharacterized protein (TIGR02147 family)